MKRLPRMAIVVSGCFLLTACAHQIQASADYPGFWIGLFHGFISPFALIGSAFMDIRVYEPPNSGGWYDLGFMLGCGLIFGASGSQTPFQFKIRARRH
jgi:hypothetical protein